MKELPKAGLGALIFNENNELFLMYRAEHLDFYPDCWFFPCGKWKYDETMSMREMNERADIDLKISQMGFKHNPDQLNERYGVDVESVGTSTVEAVKNKLKELYPNGRL